MSPNNKVRSISSKDEIEERNEIDKDCNEVEGGSCRNSLSGLQKNHVSIDDIMDVLKALMLLGFASWSGLEEGKYYKRKLVAQILFCVNTYCIFFHLWNGILGIERNNRKQMEAKLNSVFEQRKKERREYLALINATKDIDFGLYQFIVTAKDAANDKTGNVSSNETNARKHKRDVVPNNKSSNTLQIPNNNNNNDYDSNNINIINNGHQNERPKHLKEVPKSPRSPMRRRSDSKKKIQKKSKKIIRPSDSLPIPTVDPEDTDNECYQDEEEVAITWAHSVLLKEFNRRCELHDRNKEATKRVNAKLEAFQTFKRLQDEQKKKEAKKKAKEETIYKTLDSNKPELDFTRNINNNRNNEIDRVDSNLDNDNKGVEDKTEATKDDVQKTEVVFLQDQIRTEEQKGHKSMVSGIFNSNTEKEKIKEAEKVLKRLDKISEIKKMKRREEFERVKEKRRIEEEKKRVEELKRLWKLKGEEEEHDVINETENGDDNELESK